MPSIAALVGAIVWLAPIPAVACERMAVHAALARAAEAAEDIADIGGGLFYASDRRLAQTVADDLQRASRVAASCGCSAAAAAWTSASRLAETAEAARGIEMFLSSTRPLGAAMARAADAWLACR